MKKLITILTTLALMSTLAACGGNNTQQLSGGTDNTQPTKQENGSILNTGDSGDTEEIVEYDYLYGKITKITGNEIELALAKMPEDDTIVDEGAGTEADYASGGTAAVTALPAQVIDPNEMEKSMEYTGETLTLTILTGVKFDSMGQESTLSALKKGSLVSITVDNLEDMNISSVSILS